MENRNSSQFFADIWKNFEWNSAQRSSNTNALSIDRLFASIGISKIKEDVVLLGNEMVLLTTARITIVPSTTKPLESVQMGMSK